MLTPRYVYKFNINLQNLLGSTRDYIAHPLSISIFVLFNSRILYGSNNLVLERRMMEHFVTSSYS